MKLDGNGLLAAADKIQEELGLPPERATWVAGLVLSAYFGSRRALSASGPVALDEKGRDS